ncbi:unnamed protein product, partial [marine sediment metagenome]
MKAKFSKIGRRGKIGLALLVTAMFIGVASAAVLTHYNTITVNATVKQSVVVDGKDITEPISQPLNAIAGGTYCFPHWIKNRAPIDATVLFDTTCDLVIKDEITTTYLKRVPYSFDKTVRGWSHNPHQQDPTAGIHIVVEEVG